MGQSLLCPTYAEPPADPATCSSIYLHGLADTAKLVDKAVKDATNRTRRKHVQEYMDWVGNLQLPKSMQKVTPEDLCVYFTQHWIPRHAGSSVGEGRSVTAPSSLAGIRSHLSTEFELLGRTGEWNAETLQGNPTWSPLVRRLTKGYKLEAEEQGYQQKGAVPLAEEEIQHLLEHLHAQQNKTSGSTKLLHIRDGLAISCLWQSTVRGFNAGSIRLDNIKLPTNNSAVPFLTPEVKLQPGAQPHIMLDRTNNKKGGHCTISLTCDLMCFSTWLALAIDANLAAGQPITNYIVRPLVKGTSTFAETFMKSDAIWHRLTKHLKDCDIYTGQSVHSSCRGKMMHINNQEGSGWEEAGEAAMILTKQVVLKYIDEHRPANYRALGNCTK